MEVKVLKNNRLSCPTTNFWLKVQSSDELASSDIEPAAGQSIEVSRKLMGCMDDN
jgi:hypothetical protein